jgi:hypothetical protein
MRIQDQLRAPSDLVTAFRKKIFLLVFPALRPHLTPAAQEYFIARKWPVTAAISSETLTFPVD